MAGKCSKRENSHKGDIGKIAFGSVKWVFHIDIEECDICGKKVKVIACIEDSVVIRKILAHLKRINGGDKKIYLVK